MNIEFIVFYDCVVIQLFDFIFQNYEVALIGSSATVRQVSVFHKTYVEIQKPTKINKVKGILSHVNNP